MRQSISVSTLVSALLLTSGCGFGLYNDEATPDQVSATDGVATHGQWWPWQCANGTNPSPATTPQAYTSDGGCGTVGTFTLSMEGCEMNGNWDLLGLAGVTTNISSSIPGAGGWEVAGTGPGAAAWTCDAAASTSGVLTFTCNTGDPATQACQATLTPVP